jgi:hypothetical protein
LISIADDELDERKAESELARFPTVINTPFWFGKVGKELEIPFGLSCLFGDRRGRDRMVVGLTTTCAISAYYH